MLRILRVLVRSSKTKQSIASGVCLPDSLPLISTTGLSPLPRKSYIDSLTSANIIVTNLARPDIGIADKTRESSTIKFMAMIT